MEPCLKIERLGGSAKENNGELFVRKYNVMSQSLLCDVIVTHNSTAWKPLQCRVARFNCSSNVRNVYVTCTEKDLETFSDFMAFSH